jgi:WD40 repeat protein/Ca2+-binding EF-hand superfamily protein
MKSKALKTSPTPVSRQHLSEGGNANLSHGLKLEWCLGLNYELTEGTINLTNDRRQEVCYTSGHTVVIFDFERKKQRIFQGHPNKISTICFNRQAGILVTADEGETSMLIVWKVDTGVPVRTIFEPERLGIIAIDISADGEKLLTLGKGLDGTQRVRVWNWRDTSRPHPVDVESAIQFSETKYANKDPFRHIKFNQFDLTEFAATGKEELKFFRIDKSICSSYNPNSLMRKDANREASSEFTQTVFLPEEGGNVAVTGTEEGNLIVWDIILIMEEEGNLNHRREVKSINLFGKLNAKNPGVSLLTLYNKYLVVGTSAGTIRFYDFRFRIICWFEDLNLSRITSISFSMVSPNNTRKSSAILHDSSHLQSTNPPNKDLASKSSNVSHPKGQEDFRGNSGGQPEHHLQFLQDNEEDLDFPEFIVCDVDARLTLLGKHIFQEIDVSKRQGKLILQSIEKKVLCVSSSPVGNKVAIACSNSKVFEWNLCSAKLTLLKSFKDEGHTTEMPHCLSYSPNGDYLVTGTSQGNIYIKQADSATFGAAPLLISQKKKGIKCEIIRFSPDMKHFAVSDDLKCVSLFKLGHKYDDPSQPIEWVFAAKIRVHTGKINDLCFNGTGERLFSVSEDMYMAEYNILKSKDTLWVENLEKVESEDAPTACIDYPLEKNEEMVLVANAGYKLKLWNVVNQERVCRMTCLGPTFAGPINQIALIAEDMGHKHAHRRSNKDRKRETHKETEADKGSEKVGQKSQEAQASEGEVEAPKKVQTSRFASEKVQKETLAPGTKAPLAADKDNLNKKGEVEKDKKPVELTTKTLLDSKGSPGVQKEEKSAPKPKYLAFSTHDKVIGLIRLPLDGNPNNNVAIIAHSGKINYMEPTKDGKYLLTAGDNDLSLNVWRVGYEVLETSPLLQLNQKTKADIFPSLLEGGAQGQLYRDLKDFFYYCQIRRKEENTTKAHKLDGKIPLKEIPNLMISLGYYPTTREIENMQNEIKYSRLHEGIVTEDLDLETFVKLFINHRPAYGLTREYIAEMIAAIFPGGQVSRKEFMTLLTNYGEKMNGDPLDYFFATLTGIQKAKEQLPETFDVKYLIEGILGLENQEENDET